MPTTRSTIVDALRARRWALVLLAGPEEHQRTRPPKLTAEAWALFYGAECCALSIARAIRRANSPIDPGDVLTAVLRDAEIRELQRVMMARAELCSLDRLAVESGFTPAVLKGGVAALQGEPVDLGDVDLRLDLCADCEAFAAVLDGNGYLTLGPDPVIGDMAPHLARRARAGSLPVEIHIGEHDLARRGEPVVKIERMSSLVRFDGWREVGRLLDHSVVVHPHRRGHLRDLVLIAQALRHCSVDDIAKLRAELGVRRNANDQLSMLTLALTLRDQSGLVGAADPFAEVASLKYELYLERRSALMRLFPALESLSCLAFDRGGDRRLSIVPFLQGPVLSGSRWRLEWLRRRAPRLADAAVRPPRLIYRATLIGTAMIGAFFRRRRARRAVRAARVPS